MTRVVFVLQEPTPYRTPQLQAFAARPDVDATIVYAARTVQRRMWLTPEPSGRTIYLAGLSLPATRILQHDYPLTPSIWPLLTRLNPQVIVVGGWSVMAAQLAVAWARRHRVPYLLMSDNHLLEPRPLWVRALKRALLRLIVPQASGWLVPGSLAREHLLHYGAQAERILTFPLTIDVAGLATEADRLRPSRDELRRSFGIADDAVIVLHVGRLIRQKSVHTLIAAVAEAHCEASPLHLLIAGNGPEENRLRELADELDVRATFAGFLTAPELLNAYVAADVFALLSARETWGVVVNEAASCGLPLLLSHQVGAAADLLRPGENGELVESGDVTAAANALRRLADVQLRSSYGRRSRELVAAWGYEPGLSALGAMVASVTQC